MSSLNEDSHRWIEGSVSYVPFKYRPVDEVVQKTLRAIGPSGRTVEIHPIYSRGFISSEDTKAPMNIPPYDISHFDGYAVSSKDLSFASRTNPIRLKVVGNSNITEYYEGTLGERETVYTITGARVADGADSIIPVERVRVNEGFIEAILPTKSGEHVTPKGADVKRGEYVLKASQIIRPQNILMLLSLGMKTVKVYDRPSVAILSIGDELTNELNDVPPKRFETHSILLSQLIEGRGISHNAGIVKDDSDLISEKVESLLDDFDFIVAMGGTSLGMKDTTYPAISKLEPCRIMTRGIKMQPGRVTSVAIVKGKPVIMLPGHILSMVIGALFVLLPIIDGVNHLSPQHCPRIKATSSERVDVDEWKTFKRVRFVKLTTRKNGYIAEPVMGDSSMLSVLVKSNGLIVIPEGVDTVEKGEQVEVYLLPF